MAAQWSPSPCFICASTLMACTPGFLGSSRDSALVKAASASATCPYCNTARTGLLLLVSGVHFWCGLKPSCSFNHCRSGRVFVGLQCLALQAIPMADSGTCFFCCFLQRHHSLDTLQILKTLMNVIGIFWMNVSPGPSSSTLWGAGVARQARLDQLAHHRH